MKAIHILNELKFSGAEVMYAAAASEFQKLGCRLYVVNTAPSLGAYASVFKNSGYRVLHWPYQAKSLSAKIRYIKLVVSFLKQEKIDVVHIHRSDMKWLMSLCATVAGCKPVYTFHSVFRSHWYSHLYHIMLRWSAKNILGCTFQTISDSVYQNEKEYYHNSTVRVNNWYDNGRFFAAKEDERLNARNALGIKEETLVIISVGGCSHIKRHSEILKALPLILSKYPEALYLHLGEGEVLDDEMALAKSLNVDNNVRFAGNHRDVRKFLIASDIYIMTSRQEGSPITTIEALACNIPAVLYDVPGLRDFNKVARCALVIKEDHHLLAQSIMDLYCDKALQGDLKMQGKTFVDTNFSMPMNVKKIFDLYKRD